VVVYLADDFISITVMPTAAEEAAMKYRKRAEELRAEAAKTTDRATRETLLKAADACDEMATWQPYQSGNSTKA
jgi:hypothetical protein